MGEIDPNLLKKQITKYVPADAQKILAEQNRQREDKFADSWFQETNKEDILAKKFEEAMKKAKDAPAGKPIRDFDLD